MELCSQSSQIKKLSSTSLLGFSFKDLSIISSLFRLLSISHNHCLSHPDVSLRIIVYHHSDQFYLWELRIHGTPVSLLLPQMCLFLLICNITEAGSVLGLNRCSLGNNFIPVHRTNSCYLNTK